MSEAEAAAVAPPSVAEVLRGAASALAAAGCDTPRLDAELLLAFVLGVERGRLVVDAHAELDAAAVSRFEALAARRAAREPVAYILGRKEFRRITLAVDRRVLIPRPETELLVEVGLSLPSGARVVDVGTGSGAVALALKDERPDLTVVATDVDPDALAVARANGLHLGLDVAFVQADLLHGLDGRFDAVLANLPYVPSGVELPPEIARYEPARALFSGPDGLDLIRRLLSMTAGVPLVALEVGLAKCVASLALEAGFGSAEILYDLAGHERVVVARH
ncbi:MAG TPA: peptide chain release factor N(5)-glutamine methyltransferase [Solirubrobacteraceae bacterium]|nr:peptide chain release factor N(5)-glutamine methyltransferase [Solirubrobacteraceae bacterium]